MSEKIHRLGHILFLRRVLLDDAVIAVRLIFILTKTPAHWNVVRKEVILQPH